MASFSPLTVCIGFILCFSQWVESDYVHNTGVNSKSYCVGACFPGYVAASKSINTGMNHAKKDGLSEFMYINYKQCGANEERTKNSAEGREHV